MGVKGAMTSLNVILPVYDAFNSYVPFVHALKIAYASRGELEIVDVRNENEVVEQIGVRFLLEKWGILPEGSQRSDVQAAGLRIKKIIRKGDKRKEILKRLNRHSHDLMVVGSDTRYGIMGLFKRNLVEKIATNCNNPILFIPGNAKNFVAQETGAVVLNTIVIAAADSSSFAYAGKLISKLEVLFPLISPRLISVVSNKNSGTQLELNGFKCSEIESTGSMRKTIIDTAKVQQADLLIIAAKSGNFFQRKMQLLTSLEVLSKSLCPVFFLPSKFCS